MAVKRNAFGNLLNERRVFNANRHPQTSTIRTNRLCTLDVRVVARIVRPFSIPLHARIRLMTTVEIDGTVESVTIIPIQFSVCNCTKLNDTV